MVILDSTILAITLENCYELMSDAPKEEKKRQKHQGKAQYETCVSVLPPPRAQPLRSGSTMSTFSDDSADGFGKRSIGWKRRLLGDD